MWHEARKQEKLIRGMIVDYRRRAERRRDFYEKIRADPTQFLQLHGRPCKIHLDPAVAAAGEGPAIMMPWQGDHENMIDRFDVRAHLDYIPEIITPELNAEDLSLEERNYNYERYRILAQNMFLAIGEEKFLHQLSVEERFGVTLEEKEAQREKAEKKGTGVAIGYNYDENKALPDYPPTTSAVPVAANEDKEDSEEESDVEIVDVDLAIDVNKVETPQAHVMNTCGTNFGMQGTDLFSFLTGDAHDAEKQKQLIREEKEKALFSGRKSRRERRAHRDKRLALRVVSPPHYAARAPSPVPSALMVEGDAEGEGGRSPSPPPPPERITFITSFGGDEEIQDTSEKTPMKASFIGKAKVNIGLGDKSYASVLKEPPKKDEKSSRWSEYLPYKRSQRSGSSIRSLSSWSNDSRSISRSRSKSRCRSMTKSRSRSRLRSRSLSSSSSKSQSRLRSRSKSRSRDRRQKSYSDSSSSSRSNHRSPSSSSDSSRKRSYRSSSSSSQDDRRRSKPNASAHRGHVTTSGGHNSASGGHSAPKVPRYYGRKREGARDSSSELSIDSDSDTNAITTDKSKENTTGSKSSQVLNVVNRKSGAASKHAKEKMSLKERLRKKMQVQLSRQLRADMKADAKRQQREQQQQHERDEEMREMAIKIRRKQREMRHQQQLTGSSDDTDDSASPNPSARAQRHKSLDEDSDIEEPMETSPYDVKGPEKKRKFSDRSSDGETSLPPRKMPPKPKFPENDTKRKQPKPRFPVWEHEEMRKSPPKMRTNQQYENEPQQNYSKMRNTQTNEGERQQHYSDRNHYRNDQYEDQSYYGGYRDEGRSYNNRNEDNQDCNSSNPNYNNRQFNPHNKTYYNNRGHGDSRPPNFHENSRGRGGNRGGRNWDNRSGNYEANNRQRGGYNDGNRRNNHYGDGNYEGEERQDNRWGSKEHGEGSSKFSSKKLVDY